MVLIGHLNRVTGLGWLPPQLAVAGVGIFFALSGFLITRIQLDGKARGAGLNGFYSRRVVRILPIYFLVLLILAVIQPAKELAWAAFFVFSLFYVTSQRVFLHRCRRPTGPSVGGAGDPAADQDHRFAVAGAELHARGGGGDDLAPDAKEPGLDRTRQPGCAP
jgi:hypothetical protein